MSFKLPDPHHYCGGGPRFGALVSGHFTADQMHAAYEQGLAGASGAAQDAKRYQWLRKNAEVNFDEVQCWPLAGTGKKIYSRMPTKLELDAAIDAAIDEAVEAQQRGGGAGREPLESSRYPL